MSKRGTFDGVSIFFHWLTAALFVPLIASIFLIGMPGLNSGALLFVHRSTGVAIFALGIVRFAWRRAAARLPPFPGSMGRFHRAVVTGSEYLLYGLLFIQPLLGLAMMLARGHAFELLAWQVPALMRPNKPLAHILHAAHQTVGYAFLTLIFAHATAALIHHFILRDDILTAMLPPMKPRRDRRAKVGTGNVSSH